MNFINKYLKFVVKHLYSNKSAGFCYVCMCMRVYIEYIQIHINFCVFHKSISYTSKLHQLDLTAMVSVGMQLRYSHTKVRGRPIKTVQEITQFTDEWSQIIIHVDLPAVPKLSEEVYQEHYSWGPNWDQKEPNKAI